MQRTAIAWIVVVARRLIHNAAVDRAERRAPSIMTRTISGDKSEHTRLHSAVCTHAADSEANQQRERRAAPKTMSLCSVFCFRYLG